MNRYEYAHKNSDRDHEIYLKKDKLHLTFEQLAKDYNLTSSRVVQVVHSERVKHNHRLVSSCK